MNRTPVHTEIGETRRLLIRDELSVNQPNLFRVKDFGKHSGNLLQDDHPQVSAYLYQGKCRETAVF